MLTALLFAIRGQAEPIVLRDALVVSGVSRGGRQPFGADLVAYQIVSGQFKMPTAGEETNGLDNRKRQWQAITARADGWFEHAALGGGYAALRFESASDRTMMLEASGDSMAYINGECRGGDPYQYGYVRLPVHLKKGSNDLLFVCGRGRLRVALSAAPSEPAFNLADPTLPDVVPSDKGRLWGALVVVNPLGVAMDGYTVLATAGGRSVRTKCASVLAMSARKVPFEFPMDSLGSDGKLEVALMRGAQVVDRQTLSLRIRTAGQTYKRTFRSAVDGSVQYYAVVPQTKPTPGSGLVLSLHGASVEATSQADAYRSKDWTSIVCPTNRRPYGFDWEDIGRLDAMEVLNDATKALKPDPARISLTGHSMGGHGTWQVGATLPGHWNAIAPSAGWVSFFSYAGGVRASDPDPVEGLIQRASNPSDTLGLLNNLLSYPIYILHGDADDNVPVSEARTMRDQLTPLKAAFSYHEQPGAGHWWGNECVDWPPIFDLFKSARKPTARPVRFATFNPAISCEFDWAKIQGQIKSLLVSRLDLVADGKTVRGQTENVAELELDLGRALGGPNEARVELDGQTITTPGKGRQVFERAEGQWRIMKQRGSVRKLATLSGPFKNVFQKNFLFVYGTNGSAAENDWMLQKARFDAETFWYRGNGAIDVVSDRDFKKGSFKGRNVIVLGNATINSAWDQVLAHAPIKVNRGALIGAGASRIGSYASLFIYYRKDDHSSLVGAIAGTDLASMRLSDRLPYFVSGVQLPDYTIFDSKVLLDGPKGVLEAGYFGRDWSIASGESAVR